MNPTPPFLRIIRHDWAALRADRLIWVVAAVAIVAIAYGVWNGSRWVRFQEHALAQVAAEERDRYAALEMEIADLASTGRQVSPFADPRNPSAFASRRGVRHATLPPVPLAAFSIGQSDLLPYYLQVSSESRETLLTATEIEHPYRLLVGRFDLAFVVIYLYPLLVLALTYNILSSEREDGTLALVLSQPVTVGSLVSGKVTLRIGLLVGLVVACGLVALAVAAPGGMSEAGLPLALWIAAVAAYGAFWFALASLVVAFGRSSTTNATLLASAWLALVVLVPATLNLLVNALYPVPSRVQMVQAVREASDEANARGSELLAQYFEEHPELAGGDTAAAAGDFAAVRVAVADAVEREVRPVVERYELQRARQQRLVDAARYLSPAMLMQDALNDVSGTGQARHQHFLEQVTAFHDTWRNYFTPLVLERARLSALEDVPRFPYEHESAAAVGRRVAASLAGLVGPSAVLAALAVRRLRRFPVVDA